MAWMYRRRACTRGGTASSQLARHAFNCIYQESSDRLSVIYNVQVYLFSIDTRERGEKSPSLVGVHAFVSISERLAWRLR